MSAHLVVFFHRLGLKLFEVSESEKASELVDIDSINPPDITENLSEFSGKTVYLLVSDAICHVFHQEIPHQDGHLSRELVMEAVNDKFPNHLRSPGWDFKVISTDSSATEVIVYAISDEYQSLIFDIFSKLKLEVISIEPESIAVTRHPNPIIGITFGKAIPQPTPSRVLEEPPQTGAPSRQKIIWTLLSLVLFVIINFFLYQKYSQTISVSTPPPSPTITQAPSPTMVVQKNWSGLSLLIENGTTRAGYAGSVAVKFEEEGVINIKTGNASRSDYLTSQLTFKNSSLRDTHLERFNKIFPVLATDIVVDTDLETDVVLTLGIK